MTRFPIRPGLAVRAAARHGVVPATIYLGVFCLMGYSLLGTFFTAFWGDRMDALQNAWNLWWIDFVLHRPQSFPSIWQTSLLHWPFGTSLVAHPLGPFNGYLGSVLQGFLSLIPTYNALIVFALVMSGLTMYWLAYDLSRSYVGSLAAGFMFAFSSFAVMHLAAGQLDMVSMEWMPLFLLCWHSLLRRPRAWIAVCSAVALWLVALCAQYFLLYCVAAGALMLIWRAAAEKDMLFVLRREYVFPLITFAVLSMLLIAPLIAPILIANHRDPFTGAHDAAAYSMDLLAYVIPGRHWLFGEWTHAYWSKLVESAKEGEAYLALPVYAFMAYLWIKRRSLDVRTRQQVYVWSSLMGVFFLLSLGPTLHVAGRVVWEHGMPYGLLAAALPILGLSGIPARMSVMVVLSGCVLSAFALRELLASFPRKWPMTAGLLVFTLFQMLPGPIAATSVKLPEYVTALAGFRDEGGTINLVGINPSVWLYYQTVHAKPIGFGYISRIPSSVVEGDRQLQAAIDALDLSKLRGTFRIRYVIAAEELIAPSDDPDLTVTLLYERKGMRVYRLGWRWETAP